MADQRLDDAQVLAILNETGAIRHGHFVLTSGRHADTYIQCARLMESPRTTLRLAEEVARRLPEEVREEASLVISPAVGGITFGFALGLALGVDFIFAEREQGKMTLRRSFEVPRGAHVLIAEDVVTTGGSVAEVARLVREHGGEVAGVVSLIERRGPRVFDDPFWPLLSLDVPSWEAEVCPLCAEGDAPRSLGSRRLAK